MLMLFSQIARQSRIDIERNLQRARSSPTPSERNKWTRRRFLYALVASVTIATASPTAAARTGTTVTSDGIRLGDEIVLVDARALCGACSPESLARGLRFETYAAGGSSAHRSWQPSDLGSFVSFDPAVKTIIFIHGNDNTTYDAKRQGLALYRRLATSSEEPIRLVIFSWPASEVGGLLRDVRIKAARTGPAGCQLAWLIDQMPAETPVSLVGFSFGARIATGALHILGGGSINGHGLHERVHPDRAPINAILLAAAVHSHWLGEGHYHGRAMSQVGSMLLVNNSADPAMRYYRFIDRSRPQALGSCGPTCLGPEYASKIAVRDISRQIGRTHDVYCYFSAPSAVAMIRGYSTPSARAMPVLASK